MSWLQRARLSWSNGESLHCSKCGSDNREDAKFRDECGVALSGSITTKAEGAAPVVVLSAGERWHLIVLFCDLVGSTEVAAQPDPEEWRETIAAYHRTTAAAISRYRGYVAQYLGDGVMEFFGYHEAHDISSIEEQASPIALASLADVPIVPPLRCWSSTNQNHIRRRCHTIKLMPR